MYLALTTRSRTGANTEQNYGPVSNTIPNTNYMYYYPVIPDTQTF